MSRYDYQVSREISAADPPFGALIMAAMRQADTANLVLLQAAWPQTWAELDSRANSPGGVIPGETGYDEMTRAREHLLRSGTPAGQEKQA